MLCSTLTPDVRGRIQEPSDVRRFGASVPEREGRLDRTVWKATREVNIAGSAALVQREWCKSFLTFLHTSESLLGACHPSDFFPLAAFRRHVKHFEND